MENKFLKSAALEVMEPGAELSLGMNRIKDGKHYEFYARLDGELSEDSKVFVCHGYMISYGRWIEITEKELKISNYTSWAATPLTERVFEHGLKIKNFIKLTILHDTESGKKEIHLLTDGGEYTMGAGHWSCCDVDYEAVAPKVAGITPVPGGVGTVTSSVLLSHVLPQAF